MRKWIIILIVPIFLLIPVSAMEFTAPQAPDKALEFMPGEQESFSQGLLYILKSGIFAVSPDLADGAGVCLSVIAAVLVMSILNTVSQNGSKLLKLTGAVIIGILLLEPVHTMIRLGTSTIMELSEYGKLLLPVMTAAVAAQGGTTSSATLYTGTVFFIALLTTVIVRVIIPALYIYLSLCVAECAVEQEMLRKIRDFVKWAMTWCLKMILYIFSGYIGITGVISGAVDASALKAAKLTISGVVPVVGGILSDASETILASAGLMKSAAGVYGIFAILAVCVSPFLHIGAQYLLMKLSGAVCNMFGYKPAVDLIECFSTGMGMVLAMTGTVCILLLISLTCFMRGMS